MPAPTPAPVRLKLPATSANLGPGFDALGLAFGLWLEVEAAVAGQVSIAAAGRDVAAIESLEGNLLLDTYRALAPGAPPLALELRNAIPLGMGCGSSAAALLAGVLLAAHFGGLGWSSEQIVAEACRREGHPDNVAACFFGGLTCSLMTDEPDGNPAQLRAASVGHDLRWRLMLVLPHAALRTSAARAVLPESYSKADAVANVQATALLVAAFALDRPELLRAATVDRLHQPYRAALCPLLPALEPLARTPGVFAVALSGAGPAVLLLADPALPAAALRQAILSAAGELCAEVIETRIARGATVRAASPDGWADAAGGA